jgi:integrase/recombinase XerD
VEEDSVNRDNYLLIKSHLKYLKEVEQLSPISLQRYWFQLRHLLIWLDEKPLYRSPEIRPTFPVYVADLPGRRGEPSLAAVSQKKITAAARRFFHWAKTMGYKGYSQISVTWINTLRPARANYPSEEHVFVALEEATLLATFPVYPGDLAIQRDQAAAAMLFLSGARGGAFASLPIEAVDIEARCIQQWPELGVRTKNGKKATTFLLPIPRLMEVVKVWDATVRRALPPSAPWFAPIQNNWGDQRLIDNPPGETRHQILNRRLKLLFASVGLAYKSAHKFRHGHAVYGLQHAQTMADYKAVSLNLMHNDIKITDSIYAPILSEEVKNRIGALGSKPSATPDDELESYFQSLSNEQLSRALVIIAERLSR